jgi:hypothetical protein
MWKSKYRLIGRPVQRFEVVDKGATRVAPQGVGWVSAVTGASVPGLLLLASPGVFGALPICAASLRMEP